MTSLFMSRKKFFSFCIIKPSALESGQAMDILSDITGQFEVASLFRFSFERKQAEEFYRNINDKPFFNAYMDSMTGRDCYGLVLWSYHPCLVKRFRDFMGATNPKQAAPGTLRAKYAENIDNNAVHGSDSNENARREIDLLRPGLLKVLETTQATLKY
jgi:nucleoside-diphosphate kinase